MNSPERWRFGTTKKEMIMFRKYKKIAFGELRPYVEGEDMTGISVADVDVKNGSPQLGDYIARNPSNHDDQWLVSAEYFAANFRPLE